MNADKTAANIDPFKPAPVARYQGKELSCETSAGAAWLSKYLHPPCEKLDSYCGMPDENNIPSINTEYRFNRDIIPPTTVNGQTADSMLFLQTSIPGKPIIGWPIANGALIKPSDHVFIYSHEAFSPDDWFNNSDCGRFNYQSVTYSLDATSISNQGVVTSAQFRPNVELVAVQGVNPEDETTYVTLRIDMLPVNGRLMSMISPKVYSGLAREGVFVVQRMCQPTNGYKTSESLMQFGDGAVQPTELRVAINGGEPTLSLKDWNTATPLDTSALWSSDFTYAWVLFEGLTVTNNVAIGLPRINLKVVSGYEFSVGSTSSYATFARNSASYDMLAMQAATRATHAMQDGMPAAMNSFGTFLMPAIKHAPAVISALMPMFRDIGSVIRARFFPMKDTRPRAQTTPTKPMGRGRARAGGRAAVRQDNMAQRTAQLERQLQNLQLTIAQSKPKRKRNRRRRARVSTNKSAAPIWDQID